MLPKIVEEKLEQLPVQPGCYLFRDKEGVVVYVGKAKSLRSRVRSYFQEGSSDNRFFIPILRRIVGDLDTRVVASEKEACILENALIKEHKPRFNVKLRDDKEFLSLRLDMQQPYPRLELVRKPKQDKARYFGPYPSATSARRTLHLVNKHFQLRTCTDGEMAGRKRPCLQYQIKRCPGPCVFEVDRPLYEAQAKAVGLFLDGRHDELSRDLTDRMRSASDELRFELAATYRDQLRAVAQVHEGQRLVAEKHMHVDAIGLYREGDLVEVAVMFVRGGRVSDTATFSFANVEIDDDEVIAGLVRQFYDDGGSGGGAIPDEVLVPVLFEGDEGVAAWLGERRGKGMQILKPQRGMKADLVRLATENAQHSFKEKRRQRDDLVARLTQVQERLRLPKLPRRIECVDISHLGGGDTVGAIVALKDGEPDKKRYRVFHVKRTNVGDDYAAMYEVLARRFRRALTSAPIEPLAITEETIETPRDLDLDEEPELAIEEPDQDDKWSLPDLFVVDGGRGQLGVALAAARDLGLTGLTIVGLAKERELVSGEKLVDRVYLPGQKNGIALRPQSAPLFFLALARDEAHRFSNAAREKLGKVKRMASELDAVPFVGDKTKKALLTVFGTIAGVRAASDEALRAVPGVSPRVLKSLRERLGAGPETPTGE